MRRMEARAAVGGAHGATAAHSTEAGAAAGDAHGVMAARNRGVRRHDCPARCEWIFLLMFVCETEFVYRL
jgi:hypothetical protein